MIYDVRTENESAITEIVIAEKEDSTLSHIDRSNGVVWLNSCDSYVKLCAKEHAENLIKALNKAFELGWLK